ncbi:MULTISPECIES: RidA family protein [Vibrio]|uniref:RidA family protein n=1 Tax=Vibrio atlanticus TaxID=693153 RepID=A0ABV4KUF1_9VIBR|nr:RidA family protein [Vibrio crassostreae]TCT70303.1 enamine deaminase RidA (YjgF/YER057c/UK114 family) [Vibrio crassostreae]
MFKNPYDIDNDFDRHKIWEILILRDIAAFIDNDWSITEPDFDEFSFYGIDAFKSSNSDDWKVKYHKLSQYRDEWLRQRAEFKLENCKNDPAVELFESQKLSDIEITGNIAVAHKKFNGKISLIEGDDIPLIWKTLYYLSKSSGTWKVTGFTGYMPNDERQRCKHTPVGVRQHVTAGPYSPVIEVTGSKLVVISGQAAINLAGDVVGNTIEEQTTLTLKNCQQQLAQAGAGLEDVFKVNVYLRDLNDWDAFNQVYIGWMSKPYPARTAVQTELLMTLKVEVEMWAMLPE